jgi:hypothetical protein
MTDILFHPNSKKVFLWKGKYSTNFLIFIPIQAFIPAGEGVKRATKINLSLIAMVQQLQQSHGWLSHIHDSVANNNKADQKCILLTLLQWRPFHRRGC